MFVTEKWNFILFRILLGSWSYAVFQIQ
jgi:hypothetical protein